jgi:hypothetical protein
MNIDPDVLFPVCISAVPAVLVGNALQQPTCTKGIRCFSPTNNCHQSRITRVAPRVP